MAETQVKVHPVATACCAEDCPYLAIARMRECTLYHQVLRGSIVTMCRCDACLADPRNPKAAPIEMTRNWPTEARARTGG